MTTIRNFKPNIMGTVDFDGHFTGMRRPQDFIVYPMEKGEKTLKVQSDTRLGYIELETGTVKMSAAHKGGSNNVRFMLDRQRGKLVIDQLTAEDLQALRKAVAAEAGDLVGQSIVKSDNSGAAAVTSLPMLLKQIA